MEGTTEKLRVYLRKKYGPLPFTTRWVKSSSPSVSLLDEFRQRAVIRVVFQGLKNIGISFGVTAYDPAQDGQGEAQVGEVEGSPDGAGGFSEVQYDHFSAGLCDSLEFAQAGSKVWEVAESIGNCDSVELSVPEGESEGVGCEPGYGTVLRAASFAGALQHGKAKIYCDR